MINQRYSILLVLLLVCSFCKAQTTISGSVTDKKTGETIPYITVSLKLEHVYSRADDKGLFKIYSVKNIANDSLVFTGVGYFPLKIAVKDFKANMAVILTEDIRLLKEVSISGRTEMLLGAYNKRGHHVFTGASMVTRRFMKKDDYTYLKRVVIFRKRDKLSGSGKTKYRIAIYNSESNFGPPNDIVYEQILVDDSDKEEIVIDLTKYNIMLPTNFFFVGVERLGTSGKFEDPKVNVRKDVQYSWTKSFGNTTWRKVYIKPAITATVM